MTSLDMSPSVRRSVASATVVLCLILMAVVVAPALVVALEEIGTLHERRIVRIHLLVPLAFLTLCLIASLVHLRRWQFYKRLLLGELCLSALLVVAVLLLDRADFNSEGSKMTEMTGFALMGVAVLATLCGLAPKASMRAVDRVFYGIVAFAFAFASLDELLHIHERLGLWLEEAASGWFSTGDVPAGGDTITLLYGTLAIGFALLAGGVFRLKPFRRVRVSRTLFILAACAYGLSTVLDSFDNVLEPLSRNTNLIYMANSVEEILEFLAANLFLLAFMRPLFGFYPDVARKVRALLSGRRLEHPAVQWGTSLAIKAFLVAAASIPLLFSSTPELVADDFQHGVSVIAAEASSSFRPDGMTSAGNSLYVTNEATASLLLIGPVQDRQTLADTHDGLQAPESVAVGPQGTVYLSDDVRRTIFAIPKNGEPRVLLGPANGLREPKGLAIGPDGGLYIADAGAGAVLRYMHGKLEVYADVSAIASPEEVAFDRGGNLYYTSERPPRVVKISPGRQTSVFAAESSGLSAPEGVAVADDHIFITDSGRGAVFRFDPSGQGHTLIKLGPRYGRFVEGIATGEEGRLYLGIRRHYPLESLIISVSRESQS